MGLAMRGLTAVVFAVGVLTACGGGGGGGTPTTGVAVPEQALASDGFAGSVPVAATVRFWVTGSNENLVYDWSFGDGATTLSGSSAASHAYSAPGVYTVAVAVRNGTVVTRTFSQTVSVVPPAPLAGGITLRDDPAPILNSIFGLYASAQGVEPLSRHWDFGDGTTAEGAGAKHRFTAPGTYTVTHRVGNTVGQFSQSSKSLSVSPVSLQYVAGALGGKGSADGPNKQARFYTPSSVAVGSDGSLYVADKDNFTIRKIQPNGQTKTLAGFPGMEGNADGRGTAALFGFTSGSGGIKLTLDSADNVYVSDPGNRSIRRISSDGTVRTLLKLTQGSSDDLGAIAIGPDSTIYVLFANALMKVVDGQLALVAGGSTPGFVNGTASQTRFSKPSELGIAADGTIFVLETCGGVRKVRPDGQTSSLYDFNYSFNPQPGADCGPGGLAVAADGRVFFSDRRGYIFSATPSGTVDASTPYFGDAAVSAADYWEGYYHPQNMALPRGMVADSAGQLFFADSQSNTIKKIDLNRQLSTVAGLSVDDRDVSANPNGMLPGKEFSLAVDAAGNIYVAGDHCIWQIRPGQAPTLYAGSPLGIGYQDGTGVNARFQNILGINADAAGNLYVADFDNRLIRKVSAGGVVSTYAGVYANVSAPTDGPALTARFSYPYDVAVDGAGVVWVKDNGQLRRIGTDGQVTTVAGVTTISSNLLPQPTGAGGVLFINNAMLLQSVSASGSVTTGTVPMTGQGRHVLAGKANGDVFVLQAGIDDTRVEVRRLDSSGGSTVVASMRQFSASVAATGTTVEFTMPALADALSAGRQITSAVFAPDGGLLMASDKKVFRAVGF